jgi:hypothetical protein
MLQFGPILDLLFHSCRAFANFCVFPDQKISRTRGQLLTSRITEQLANQASAHPFNGSSRTSAELLASCVTSGALPPVEIDFSGRNHGHSSSHQTRREKTREAVRQVTAPIKRSKRGSQSFRRFDQSGTKDRKKARPVCCCESKDRQSRKKAMGEVSGASEKSDRMSRHA